MGGTKKKTLASMEKSQNDEAEQPGAAKKTPAKESKPFGERKRIEVLMPRLSDQELLKSIAGQKAITIYSAAKSLNVSAGVARAVLASLEQRGMLMRVGGFSGHYIWAPASTSRS